MTDKVEQIAEVYHLLSRVFIKEIDSNFLTHIRAPSFYQAMRSCGMNFGREFQIKNSKELLEDLAVEYTGLFVIGGRISPYESVFLKGRLWTEETIDVSNFYSSAGFKVKDNLIPDHIGLELEFLYHLKEREKEDDKWKEIGSKFLEKHLLQWAFGFFDKVIEVSRLCFYREMAKLGKEFLTLK